MKNDRTIGIKEIAHSLGCSTRTIRRYHADSKLKTFKVGGDTSPIKMRAVDLTRLLAKKGKA